MGNDKEVSSVGWVGCLVWSGISLCAFYLIATLPIWMVGNHELFDLDAIRIELAAFILVMAIGEFSSSGSAKKDHQLDSEGGAKVALFVILAVLPEYMDYVIRGSDESSEREVSTQALTCIFKIDGYLLVSVLLFIGLTCAIHTARVLHLFDLGGRKLEKSSIPSLGAASTVVAILMLSIYLFLKHISEQQFENCSNQYYSRAVLQGFLVMLLGVICAMFTARAYSVYVIIPFFINRQREEFSTARSAYQLLLLLIAVLLIFIGVVHYWDKILASPIFLILFGLFVCFAVVKLISVLPLWKKYYPHVLLVLITIIVAAAITYFAMAFMQNKSNEILEVTPLDDVTIEYLDQIEAVPLNEPLYLEQPVRIQPAQRQLSRQ